MGLLGVAGGMLAVATAILPPPAEGSEDLILIAGALSALSGGYLLSRRPMLGERELLVMSLVGTALITIATREGGIAGGTADNEILYLWVILYSFYFLSLPNGRGRRGLRLGPDRPGPRRRRGQRVAGDDELVARHRPADR